MPALRLPHLSPAAQGGLFYFGFYGASAAYIPFLNVFFAHRGLSGSEIGLLAAIGPLTAFLVAPGLAALADRRGWHRLLLSLALAGTALCLLALPLPSSFAWLLPVVALLAAVGSPIIPIADGLVAALAARRGVAYGTLRLWGSLSWALVAAAGGWLWQEWGFGVMLPLASLLFLATIPIAQRLTDAQASASPLKTPWAVVLGDGRLRVVLVATFVLGLGMALAATFAGIYLDRLSGGQLLVGVFSGVTAISELPIMHWSERIMQRLGGPWTLVLAYALLGSSYGGLVWLTHPVLLLGLAILQGLGFGLFLPTTVRLVAGWSPGEWASTAQGLLNAALWGLAPLIAGPLGGLIYDAAGPGAVFLVCAAATAGAGLVLILAQLAGAFTTRQAAPEG